jgi:hypothetical protein
VLIAFGAFFALVGGICSGVGLTGLAESDDQIGAQVSEGFLIVGVFVFGGGALLLFLGIRSERWRPTAQELARQKDGDIRTLYFRPVGLLIFVIGLGGFIALGFWLNQFVPGIFAGRRSPLACIFALVMLALLSFRKVRNLVFYTGDKPDASEANKTGSTAEPLVAADRPGDHGHLDTAVPPAPARNPQSEAAPEAEKPRKSVAPPEAKRLCVFGRIVVGYIGLCLIVIGIWEGMTGVIVARRGGFQVEPGSIVAWLLGGFFIVGGLSLVVGGAVFPGRNKGTEPGAAPGRPRQ